MAVNYWFGLFVFFNGILVTLLALNISYRRIRDKIPNGDGNKVEMKKAIRAHGNGVEHVSLYGLIVLALCLSPTPERWLALLVLGFTIARLIHAIGMLGSIFNARRTGAALTYFFELAALVAVLRYAVFGRLAG